MRCAARHTVFVKSGDIEPFAGGLGQALSSLVDALHRLAEAGDDSLVAAELRDLGELLLGLLLQFPELPGALVQGFLALRRQHGRSLRRKARAQCRQLQAGGEARNVPPAQFSHASAEILQCQAGAGRDHKAHARDHRKGGEQAAAHAPYRHFETRPQTAEWAAKAETTFLLLFVADSIGTAG